MRGWWQDEARAVFEDASPRLLAFVKWLFEGGAASAPARSRETPALPPAPAETPALVPAEAAAAPSSGGSAASSSIPLIRILPLHPPATAAAEPGEPAMESRVTTSAGLSYVAFDAFAPTIVLNRSQVELIDPAALPVSGESAESDRLRLGGGWTGDLPEDAWGGGLDRIDLDPGSSYALASADSHVAAGDVLIVQGRLLGAGEALSFDGSAETDGRFYFEGGAGADAFVGGAGSDHVRGGGGADTLDGRGGADVFLYGAAAESSGASYDTLVGFDASGDRIDLEVEVTGFAEAVASGTASAASFDEDLAAASAGLGAGQALLFTPDAGDLAGKAFLIVDANGEAGYQAGEDFVFHLAGAASLDGLTAAIFV